MPGTLNSHSRSADTALQHSVVFLLAIPNSLMPPNCVLSANIISSFLFFVPEENYLKLSPSNFTHYVPLVLSFSFQKNLLCLFLAVSWQPRDLQLKYQSLLIPTQTIISHVALLSEVLPKSRQIRSKAFPLSKKAHGELCLLFFFFFSYQVSLTQVTLVNHGFIFIIFCLLLPCLQVFLQN